MFNFLRNKRYTKRKDGKFWTKKEAIHHIASELADLNPKILGSSLRFDRYPALTIEIIASNYAESNELELNGSIILNTTEGEQILWSDLFSECKSAYGEKYKGLHLWRDELWEDSRLQKECREVFRPIIATLLDENLRYKYMSGERVLFEGKIVPGPYRDNKSSIEIVQKVRVE